MWKFTLCRSTRGAPELVFGIFVRYLAFILVFVVDCSRHTSHQPSTINAPSCSIQRFHAIRKHPHSLRRLQSWTVASNDTKDGDLRQIEQAFTANPL